MPKVGRGDFIYLLTLFFIILIFNSFVCLGFISIIFKKVIFHTIQGSKLKLQLKNEKEVF